MGRVSMGWHKDRKGVDGLASEHRDRENADGRAHANALQTVWCGCRRHWYQRIRRRRGKCRV
eukprot:359756-Rhodomonas_salina.1